MTDYVATPRTDDPAELLREKDITIRYLLRELEQAHAETAQRERVIGALIADGLGNDTSP